MSSVIAGAATGLLMASLFICVGCIMLFVLVRDPMPGFQAIFQRFSPAAIVMPVVILAYPVWGFIGGVMGLMYHISREQAPGSGIGSSNLVFTVAVVMVTVVMVPPVAVLLRRVIIGVFAIAGAFAGIFGWLLPFFAS